jgi:hypothetical protein
LKDLLSAQTAFEREAKVADQLYVESLSLTGLQASFESLQKSMAQRSQQARSSVNQRLREMAKEEVAETQKILKKLHIVEAEVLQQVSLSERIAKTAKTESPLKVGTTGSRKQDVLRFPKDSEFWFDEVGQYKVDIKKACVVTR